MSVLVNFNSTKEWVTVNARTPPVKQTYIVGSTKLDSLYPHQVVLEFFSAGELSVTIQAWVGESPLTAEKINSKDRVFYGPKTSAVNLLIPKFDQEKHLSLDICGESTLEWAFRIFKFEKLVPIADDRKKLGLCPHCGESGSFVRTALMCSRHGIYGGF